MTITSTGDATINGEEILVRTGDTVIDGAGGGLVDTVDRLVIYGSPGGGQGAGQGSGTSLTLSGGPDPVAVTVGDQSTAGDPGSILVASSGGVFQGDERATLTVTDGATLISRNTAFYDNAASAVVGGYSNVLIGQSYPGAVTVSGAGSSLLAYGTGSRIVLGAPVAGGQYASYGEGRLTVEDGGRVGALSVFGGYEAAATITVTGGGSVLAIGDAYGQYGGNLSNVAGGLTVGRDGFRDTSSLIVEAGGTVEISNTDGVTDAPFANFGLYAGAQGYASLSGTGAALNITQLGDAAAGGAFLGIAREGYAAVSVSDGAAINVTGDNAAISLAQTLDGARNDATGGGGTLTITSGADVTVDSGTGDGGGLQIGVSGFEGGADVTSRVTVDGEGSTLSLLSDAGQVQSFGAFLNVGVTGNGALSIINGGDVLVDGGGDILPVTQIAVNSSSTSAMTVDGAGSTFTLTGDDDSHLASAGLMIVGRNAGADGTLTVSGGGTVTLSQDNSLLAVANEANSAGTVVVTGAGSSLTGGLVTVSVDNDFNFANPGASVANGGVGRIEVRNGGTLTAERLTIGDRGSADLTGTVIADLDLHGELSLAGGADGALTLTGDLVVADLGALVISISSFSAGLGDRLTIEGDAAFGDLAGDVTLSVFTNDNFDAGDQFVLATATGALTAETRVITDADTGLSFTLAAQGNDLILTANESQVGDDGFLEGDDSDNLIDGGEGDDTIFGFGGDDTLIGGEDDDLLIGGAGADDLNGGDGFDFISFEDATRRVQVDTTNRVGGIGDAAGDTYTSIEGIIGTRFNDNLRGGNEANDIRAGSFSDRVFGRGGDDTLDGGIGADAIYGNSGTDELTGGAGRDRFIFFNPTETRAGEGQRDVITDFDAAAGERLEIRRFDADTTQGRRQAFDFIAEDAFSGTAGELRFDRSSGISTIVQGDTNGDGTANFEIELTGVIDLTEANFFI